MAAADASPSSSSASASAPAPRRVNTPPSSSSNNGSTGDSLDPDLELELDLEHPEPYVADDVEWGRGGSRGQGDGRSIQLTPLGGKQEYGNRHDDAEDAEDEEDEEEKRFLPGRGTGGGDADDAGRDFELYTPDEEAAVVKRLDRRLVLFMGLLYMLSFLDRSNIGNAKIAGMSRDLSLSSDQYEWLLTSFYITYILFEFSTLLYRLVPPHIYIPICVFSWGLIASLQSLSTSFGTLIALRALLGVSEAAFGPGVPFYLSFFFRRDELAFRTGLFISAAPLATSFASTLAWLITKLGEGGPWAPWRLLFLVEGFPSLFVAIWAWSFVPDGPGEARWLSAREREVAVLRLRGEREMEAAAREKDEEDEGGSSLRKGTTKKKRGVDFKEVLQTLMDPKCYLTAFMFFSCNVAFSSVPVFLPTIIKEMGYTSLTSQALSAPPYLISFLTVLATASLSDRYRTRSLPLILHALLASLSFTLICLLGYYSSSSSGQQPGSGSESDPLTNSPTDDPHPPAVTWTHFLRYLALYPATAGFFSAVTLIIAWTLNNQETATRRGAGMAVLNVVGQCGPLLGTRLFPEEEGPYYVRGLGTCAGFMMCAAVLAAGLRCVLARENARRRRRRERGAMRGEDVDVGVGEDEAELGVPLVGGGGDARGREEEEFLYML
ncbi:mfs transporter [Diplodia corticola]|uniref:Mfs transporter n=1 Tax=Diplodia corticola TaxID=236234 RepID=A0A1J9RFP0_9PEZI|nr:mfs transporter [Diplodia corticola]OJD40350.1 mfs transporter [Diplodia corticola]